MKLSTKQFEIRYPYWIPFARAHFLFTQCEYNSILCISASLSNKKRITSYFALYPDIYGFPFDTLETCYIFRYTLSDYKSDLSHLLSFIHSLNDKQFDYFIDEIKNSCYPSSSYISFLTDKFHEVKR